MILEIIGSVFLLAGSLFMLIASLGVFRLPDVFMRMHASTKAVSMGMMLLLVGVSVLIPDISVIGKSLAIIIFFYLTLPVSTNLLGKSALDMNLKRWEKTQSRNKTRHK